MIRWKPAGNNSLANGLVAAYLMTNRAGTKLRDASGFSNTGTLTNFANNTTDWTAGVTSNAIFFPNTTTAVGAVTTNNILNDMSAMTLMALVRHRSGTAPSSAFRQIISKAQGGGTGPTNGWFWHVSPTSGEMRFRIDFATTDLDVRQVLGVLDVFVIYAVTWNGSTTALNNVKFYRNGINIPAGTNTNAAGARNSDTANPVRLGNSGSNDGNWFGEYGPAYIWNRALSAEEVKQMAGDIFLPFRVRDNRYFIQTPAAAAPVAVTVLGRRALMGMGM